MVLSYELTTEIFFKKKKLDPSTPLRNSHDGITSIILCPILLSEEFGRWQIFGTNVVAYKFIGKGFMILVTLASFPHAGPKEDP